MIDFGFDKLALIGAVALIVIGPEKLPRVARTVGTLLGKAQRYVADVKAEVNRSIELEELKKMKTEFEDAARDVERPVAQRDPTRPRAELGAAWQPPADTVPPLGSDAARRRRRPPSYRHAEEELAPEARRDAAVVQAEERRARQGAVGRRARGALPAAPQQRVAP